METKEENIALNVDYTNISSMQGHTYTKEELERQYDTNLQRGLTTDQHAQRFQQFGKNQISPPSQSLWKQIQTKLPIRCNCCNIISIIFCFIGFGLNPFTMNIPILILGILICIVECCCGFVMKQFGTNSNNESINLNIMQTVIVIRNGEQIDIQINELVPGDIVVLSMGMTVPADMRIFECSVDLCVDNSSLTGESEPLKRDWTAQSDNVLISEADNICFFGTIIVTGTGTAVVLATGDKTFMGRTAQLASIRIEAQVSRVQYIANGFTSICSCCNFILSIIFFILVLILNDNIIVSILWFIFGLIVLLISMFVPLYLMRSQSKVFRDLMQTNVLLKSIHVVDMLSKINCVVIGEKTGCVTTNVITAQHVYYDLNEIECDTSNPNNAIAGQFYNSNKSRHATLLHLIRCVGLNINGGNIDIENNGMNITEMALARFTIGHIQSEYNLKLDEYRTENTCLFRIPFNSKNKWDLTVNLIKQNYLIGDECDEYKEDKACMFMKGAPERVLSKCNRYLINNEIKELTDDIKTIIIDELQTLGLRGQRVLGFAELLLVENKYTNDTYEFGDTDDLPMDELIFIGLIGMIDPPRAGILQTIMKFKNEGIKVVMLSGDHIVTCESIARQIGVLGQDSVTKRDIAQQKYDGNSNGVSGDEYNAVLITGYDYKNYSDVEKQMLLQKEYVVCGRISPAQKVDIVQQLQQMGYIVLVSGRGAADAPGLKAADIGVAMGIDGTEIAKEASDMILLDDNFDNIYQAIQTCKDSVYAKILTKIS